MRVVTNKKTTYSPKTVGTLKHKNITGIRGFIYKNIKLINLTIKYPDCDN